MRRMRPPEALPPRGRVVYLHLMGKRRVVALPVLGLLLYTCAVDAQVRTVAMTVDDLPLVSGIPEPEHALDMKNAERVNEAILHAFTRHHIPATGFVIERRAEDLGLPVSRKILKLWTRPGFDLGNHLYSHPDVNALSVDQIEEEVTRGEAIFAPLLKSTGRNRALRVGGRGTAA